MREENCLVQRSHGGRQRNVRTIETEERILDIVHQDPTTSVRRAAREIGISASTVHRLWTSENLHPFHRTPVHELHEGDRANRVQFCRWLIEQNEADETFLRRILWTDESLFIRGGLFNVHNYHYWAEENPFVSRMRGFQHRWKLNIWAGILGNRVIGPYMLPEIMASAEYLIFVRDILPNLLPADVQLENIWFQHDGAPPHNSRQITNHLTQVHGQNWIGYRGPVRWPARSPDLTPMDFFLWEYLKEVIYHTEPESAEDLIARLHIAVANISDEIVRTLILVSFDEHKPALTQTGDT